MNDKESMAEAAQIDATLKHIAKMLREARAPLIYGLTQLTVEAQELAVELAMCLRGAIDTPRGSRIPPRGTSLQLHGETRTTMGELRQYADLLVFVDCDPTPELRESFAIAGSKSLPSKQCVQLKSAPSVSASLDTRVRELCCRNRDEVLDLRKKLKSSLASDSSQEQLLAVWQTAKYPVLVYNPASLAQLLGKNAATYLIEELELAALARARHGRAASWPLEEAGNELSNAAGAEYVLTARTGFPAAVRCFSGCAEFLPGISNAEALLADGISDAVLFLGEGACAAWSTAAQQQLKKNPTAIIASTKVLAGQTCKQQVACSELSAEQGTIVREDGIPLQLAGRVAPKDSAEEFLRRLLELVREPVVAAAGAVR